MDCIRCGCQAGYNRAIVDTASDTELGGFCRNCEFDEFGRTLERCHIDDRRCLICNRDGHFGFAAWTSTVEAGEKRHVSSVDYEVTDRTPFLCDEHFHAVKNSDDPEQLTGRVRR